MPKVRATKTPKIQFILQDFPEKFIKTLNNKLYCNVCSCTISCHKYFFVPKPQKMLGRKSPYILQMFLTNSNTNFVEKVIKAFFSAHIPLYKLNNKHIKNLFHDIYHSLSSDTICRKTVLQLSTDELQQKRKAVHDKQIFLVVGESTYLAYNIQVFQ